MGRALGSGVVWSRLGLVAVLALALLNVPPAAAQAPEFLLLGEDATGDAKVAGTVPMLDTWVDINHLGVATVGTDLVFHLGLEGTTTEAGQYCWMAAFEFGGTEYVGLDCYEAVAYENDNTLSGVLAPDTTRGENVASSVVFDDTGAVITIPLASIGANVGDTIEDIYGLTYATRRLNVVDVVPDAKSTVDAEESLGSYVIGGGSGTTGPEVIHETLNGTSVQHDFTEARNATYVLNVTVPFANASVAFGGAAQAGSANVTIARGNDTLLTFLADNTTLNGTAVPPQVLPDAGGNWTVTIVYVGYVGTLALDVTEAKPAGQSSGAGTGTHTASPSASGSGSLGPAADDGGEENAPGPGPALLALALVGAAFASRRRQG